MNNNTISRAKIARAYLEICDDNECFGDDSVGIPPCQFVAWPDQVEPYNPKCRLKTIAMEDNNA